MKQIYGPVQSRRLGLSLGVSLTAYKTCNFDCVYCQLGPTTNKAVRPKACVRPVRVIAELKTWLFAHPDQAEKLDYISIAGSGEPTLNTGIGTVIRAVKKLTPVKVAVLTNASRLSDPSVRGALLDADLVVPSLDAAAQDVFEAIDRPLAGIGIDSIISGLEAFRREFRHALWLEVMIVAGINDSPEHIRTLKKAIRNVKPDKIQLNSPVRSTTEPGVKPASRGRLLELKKILGSRCEIV